MTNSRKDAGDMTLDDFEALIGAYGADPGRWPEDERETAEAFLAQSEDAQAALAAEAALDGLLDEAPTAQVHSALVAEVLAAAPNAQGARQAEGHEGLLRRIARLIWPQTGIARPAALLTASLAMGFYMGMGASGATDTPYADEDYDMFAYVFDVSSDWYDDEGEDVE